MNNKIVLLAIINSRDVNTSYLGINEYQGLGYISAYLKENGFNVKTYIASENTQIENIIKEEPAIVGLNMYTDTVLQVLNMAQKIRNVYPQTHITVGGPQVNGYEKAILYENKAIDSVISYEGELTFCTLARCICNGIRLGVCDGLTYRNIDGSICSNPFRQPLIELDQLPNPDREIYQLERQPYMYITGTRGCLGNCSFCGETYAKIQHKSQPIRYRSAEKIVDEIEQLQKTYNIDAFRFTDATFEDPGKEGLRRANKIFDLIIHKKLKISLHLFTRAEIVIEHSNLYLEKAREAGVECFYIGVESASDIDLAVYNKKSRSKVNLEAIDKIRRSGIHVGMGFICFNPYSTWNSLKENAEFLYNSGLGHVFYLLQTRLEVLPQSIIKKKMIKDGLLDEAFDYKSNFYDYRFKEPGIGEFFSIIKQAYTQPPIYYMDTILGMNRVWLDKNLGEREKIKINNYYKNHEALCREFNQKNYELFMTCLEIGKNGGSQDEMREQIQKYNLNEIYTRFLNNYNLINTRITKMRFMQKLQKNS